MHTSLFISLMAATAISAASPGPVESAESDDSRRSQAVTTVEPAGNLTLEQAVSRALNTSPSLAAGSHAVSAAEARVTQAGRLPNPELEIEVENFGGRGVLDDFNGAESTAVIRQPFLLGGKRRHRRAVAQAERALAGRDLEALRLDVSATTTSAFYRVLAAQRREALARELLDLVERFADTVQKRVEAGKVSPVQALRAGVEVSQARVGVARAERALEAARAHLAATWGSFAADFDRAAGELPAPTDPPALDQLRGFLTTTPEVRSHDDLIDRHHHLVELEHSFRIPDLSLSVGPRRFEETGESAWVAGIALPIPIFDRNQGSRRAAEFDLERARRNAEAVRVGLESRLAAATERLRALAFEVTALSHEIVPAARAAFASTETGYREGKFGFLEVLDAQRALFDARMLLLDSREEHAIARTRLERLIGRPLSPPDAVVSHTGPSQGEER